jgi:hypothetical protein
MSVYAHREISPKLSIKLRSTGRKIEKQVENREEMPRINARFACIPAVAIEMLFSKVPEG